MPTSTYDLIASNVLGSTASSVTFSSIPATYQDLVLVSDGLATSSSEANLVIRLNGDSSNVYTAVTIEVDKNNNLGSSGYTNTRFFDAGFDGTLSNSGRNISIFQIMDYATNKHKTCFWRCNNALYLGLSLSALRYPSTSVINSVTITAEGTNFATGATFYLYGIAA
jgi:hypothetical protein